MPSTPSHSDAASSGRLADAALPRWRVTALVPAGGRGLRMGGDRPKQFLSIGGVPLMVHALRTLQQSPLVREIIVAVPAAEREYCARDVIARYQLTKARIVDGGGERQDSVRAALAAVDPSSDLVLVHDAVRPFLTQQMIAEVCDAAAREGGAIIAIPARDTLKDVGEGLAIQRTVDRSRLWQAQTPQTFRRELLQRAHAQAKADGYLGTDEADLVQRLGERVVVVEGSGENIKVTRPEDLIIGEAIWASRQGARAGAASEATSL